jgi:FKBP-type peptidyl-prolyl cis-trans isomerase SlyD
MVADGMVVSLDYTLTVDNEVVDTSEGSEPIEFIQGHQHIIPGLEKELYGLAVGGTKAVSIQPEDAYGLQDPEAFMDVPRSEFPAKIPLEPGTMLQMRDQDGQPLKAHIVQVDDKTVRLDFNHPLAGKELHFSVKVMGLRPATAEELEHDHVHEADHQH